MSIQTTVETPTEQKKRQPLVATWQIAVGVIVLLAITSLSIWGLVWLAQTAAPSIEAIRDIFIIVLALESCIFGIVLMLLLIMVIRLVNMIEFEVKPILEKTNETVGVIRGTTVFVSRNVVKPVTTANSYIAGIRRGLQVLLGDPKKNLHD